MARPGQAWPAGSGQIALCSTVCTMDTAMFTLVHILVLTSQHMEL